MISLDEAAYGYWGFSPASDPAGGYRQYGEDAIGMDPNGYTSAVDRLTLVDNGWDDPDCQRDPSRSPTTASGRGAARGVPGARLRAGRDDGQPGEPARPTSQAVRRGGFKDSVNVATGQVADRYLALDKGMVIAAAANVLLDDHILFIVADDHAANAISATHSHVHGVTTLATLFDARQPAFPGLLQEASYQTMLVRSQSNPLVVRPQRT